MPKKFPLLTFQVRISGNKFSKQSAGMRMDGFTIHWRCLQHADGILNFGQSHGDAAAGAACSDHDEVECISHFPSAYGVVPLLPDRSIRVAGMTHNRRPITMVAPFPRTFGASLCCA
jgi:hypothetical protein